MVHQLRMFRKAMQQFIKQIDSGGDLIPATSVYDSEKFKPLCLVCRRMGGPFWRKAKYSCTEFKLKQILIDDDSLPTVQQNDMSFQFSKSLERPMKGTAVVNTELVTGNIEITDKLCTTIQLEGTKQVYVSVSELTESLENRKVGRLWDHIKNSYSEDLCVVTEALVSVQSITLKKINERGSQFYITLPFNSLVGAEYNLAAASTLCIPDGAVLAYKVWNITVTNEGMLCLSKPSMKGQTKLLMRRSVTSVKSQKKSWMCLDSTDVSMEEGFEICRELQCLNDGLKQHLLDLVYQIIEDSELHAILSDMLSDACAGLDYNLSELNQLEEGRRELGENLLAIWSEEQLKNATEDQLVKAVSFLLAALEDLPPATLRLLMQSLKMQILSQQFTLVTTILKDLEHSQADQILKVETGSFTEDAFGITADLLNEIGLHLERDSVQKKGELYLCELPIALCCLNLLTSK
ncbi:gasdermin-A2-like isoform X1 [Hemitrygon akajei]|uniref:gasdermin-A2-like isoform X1 n=2 Tax=Hemitrygon akajei TaxID=2704970 RepID=UPI003BF9AD9A